MVSKSQLSNLIFSFRFFTSFIITFWMKGSGLRETHRLRVDIGFHTVNLSAKFSCDIVLVLKTQSSILKTSSDKLICQTVARPLVEGKCQVNQQLQLDWQSVYDVGKSQYLQTTMQITVLLNSINGSIQAGICVIDVTRNMKRSTLPLKKCSDKSASICISSSFEFMQVINQKQHLESSKQSFPSNPSNGSPNHKLKKMKSVQYLPKNDDSNLSISKITVSNKRLEGFLRGQNEQLQRHNQIVESKLKLVEKREKQLMQQLKQSHAKYQKLNIRSLQQASIIDGHQITLEQKDKAIKILQSELKKIQFKVKQLSDQQQNYEKKIQLKEQSYQEQIKRYVQKVSNLQIQLQQSAEYQNNLLAKYEIIEKNAQVLLKEKQRSYAVQKSKLTKQLIDRDAQNDSLRTQVRDLKEKIAEIQHIRQLQKKGLDLQSIKLEKDKEIDQITQQNIKLKQKYKEILAQLQQLQQSNESRHSLRKRLSQVQSQNNSLKIQLQKANQILALNESKMKETIDRLEQTEKQRKKLQITNDQLASNLHSSSIKSIELQKENNYYKECYQKLAEIHNQIKQKKEEIELRMAEEYQAWSKQLEVLAAQRSKFQSQNIDLKWQLQRYESSSKENQLLLNAFKAQNFQLKQQLLLKSEKMAQIQTKCLQLNQTILNLDTNLEVSESKIKQLLKINTQKATLILSTNKEKQKLVDEIDIIKKDHLNILNAIKQEIQEKNDLTSRYQREINEITKELKASQSQILSKQVEIQCLKKQNENIKQSYKGILEQNQMLSEENIKISCDLTHKQTQTKNTKELATQLKQQNQKIRKQLEQLEIQYQQARKMFDRYKQTNSDAVRWVLCILGQQELIVQKQTVFFPEENLRQLQIQAIKNRNLFLSKLKNSMKATSEEKQFLAFELEKIGQELVQSSNDYEQLLQREKQLRQIANKEYLSERQELIEQIQLQKSMIAELKVNNDKYFKQSRLLEHQVSELEGEKAALIRQKQQMQEKINEILQEDRSKSQKLILSQKEIAEKEMLLSEERKAFLIEEQKEKKKFQEQIAIIHSKIALRQQDMVSKIEKIKSLEEKCIVLESEKRKIEFSYLVQEQLSKENQKKLEENFKQKGELLSKIQSLQVQIQKQQKLILQNEVQIAQELNRLSKTQQKFSQAIQINQKLAEQIKALQEAVVAKTEENRDLKIRAKQMEETYNKSLESLGNEINKFKGQIEICKMLNQNANSQLQEKVQQIKQIQHQLESKRQYVAKLESDNQMIHKEVYFEQSHKNNLQRQFEQLTENYDQAKSDIYHLEEEKLKLQKEIERLKYLIQEKERSIEKQIQNSRMRVSKQISDLKKRIQSQESKSAKLQAKCQDLKNQIKQLSSTVDKKQFLLMACEQQKQKNRCDLQDVIQRLNNEIEKLQDRHEEAENQYRHQRQQLLNQIQQLNQQYMQLNEQKRNKEKEIEENHKQHDSFLRKIALLESQIRQKHLERSPNSDNSSGIKNKLDQIKEQKQVKVNRFNLYSKEDNSH